MAAQLSTTKGLAERGLKRCKAWATTSLPVPVSPSISTVAVCARNQADGPRQLQHDGAFTHQAFDSLGGLGAAARGEPVVAEGARRLDLSRGGIGYELKRKRRLDRLDLRRGACLDRRNRSLCGRDEVGCGALATRGSERLAHCVEQLMAAGTSGPASNGVAINAQQLHARIERTNLLREFHDFEVGEPVVQQQGFCLPNLQLGDGLGAAAGLTHIPAQAAQAVPQPLPQRCVCACQYHALIQCDACRCHVILRLILFKPLPPLGVRLCFHLQQPLPHVGDDVEHAPRLFEPSLDCFLKGLRVPEHRRQLQPALQSGERLAKVVKLKVALRQIDRCAEYCHDRGPKLCTPGRRLAAADSQRSTSRFSGCCACRASDTLIHAPFR